MSSGVLVGMNNAVRLVRGTTRLPIVSASNLNGLSVIAGDRFTLTDAGVYTLFFSIRASGAESDIPFSIELYNETLGFVEQSFAAVTPPSSAPVAIPVMFVLTASNPATAYSFRISAPSGGMPDYVLDLSAPAFYCVVSAFFGASSGGSTGVENVLWTADLDLKATSVSTILIPSGSRFFVDEVGVIATQVSGAVVTQPTMSWGISGSNAKYLAATTMTLLTTAGKRERFQMLLQDDAEASLTVAITGAGAGPTSYIGRAYMMGRLATM